MFDLKTTLLEGGLDKSTVDIFLILHKNGEMTVPELLKKTSLSRATVYDSLTHLVTKKYLDYRKEGRSAFYRPAHPETLVHLIEEKRRSVSVWEDQMKEAISNLTNQFNLHSQKPGIQFFQGVEGLKELFTDTLRGDHDLIQAVYPLKSSTIHKDFQTWVHNEWPKMRLEKGVREQSLVSYDDTTLEAELSWLGEEKTEKYLSEVRGLTRDTFPVDTEIMIYGDNKVSFTSYSPDEMIGTIITSPAIHQTMKALFNTAWVQGKKIF